MKYAIIYDSVTGNTKTIADTINKALTKEECIYFGDCDGVHQILSCDVIFLGSWCDKGELSDKIKSIFPFIKNNKVAIFGTCGFGKDSSYFENIAQNMKKAIPSTIQVLNTSFICQGKMPMSIKKRYEDMLKNSENNIQIQEMIENFDMALSHPDKQDKIDAIKFALACCEEA